MVRLIAGARTKWDRRPLLRAAFLPQFIVDMIRAARCARMASMSAGEQLNAILLLHLFRLQFHHQRLSRFTLQTPTELPWSHSMMQLEELTGLIALTGSPTLT